MINSNNGVERVTGLGVRSFLRNYARRSRPVIMTDAAAQRPCLQRWNFDFLRTRFGDRPVELDQGTVPLAGFLERVAASRPGAPGPYLHDFSIEEHLPELLPDIVPYPGNGSDRLDCSWLPRSRYLRSGRPELLIAGTGTDFPVLHYDLWHTHAFITQICGDKQFWLYGPEQTPWLYPRPDHPNRSAITGFDPVDQDRFPQYARATPIEAVVHPGETIFVPGGWWHRTRILSPSIAVTTNSVSRANWKAFVHDYVGTVRAHRPVRTAAKEALLRLLGAGLFVRECVTDRLR